MAMDYIYFTKVDVIISIKYFAASVDSTSEDKPSLADLNAGSPMAVTLQLSPG